MSLFWTINDFILQLDFPLSIVQCILPRDWRIHLIEMAIKFLVLCIFSSNGRRQIVEQKERGIFLGFLIQSLMQETNLFIVFCFDLALDALILHKSHCFLLLCGSMLHLGRWQRRLLMCLTDQLICRQNLRVEIFICLWTCIPFRFIIRLVLSILLLSHVIQVVVVKDDFLHLLPWQEWM